MVQNSVVASKTGEDIVGYKVISGRMVFYDVYREPNEYLAFIIVGKIRGGDCRITLFVYYTAKIMMSYLH